MNSAYKKENQKVDLSFYDTLYSTNTEKMSYEVFKNYAYDRMKILRKFENGIRDFSMIEDKQHDLLSHFCLRLIAVQTEWSTNWFVKYETELFKKRLMEKGKEIDDLYANLLLRHYKNFFNKISIENENAKKYKSSESYKIGPFGYFDPDFDTEYDNVELVHFLKIPDLIGTKHCDPSYGYCKINKNIKISHMAYEFKRYLTNKMLKQNINSSLEDERLLKLHNDIFLKFTPLTTEENNTSISNINKENFPLCMKLLFEKIKQGVHLKFNDRNQLILFLKDLKIPLHETLNFMRSSLPTMKEKELAYSVRHNYGLEGKRANYSCFSCLKIKSLASEPNSTGCPFVNNKNYARQYVDIEDGVDFLQNCKSHLCSLNKNMDISAENVNMKSPAEFYNILKYYKNKEIEK